MSIADCLDIATQVANSVTPAPVYGAVAQLTTGETVVQAVAAQNDWTDTIAEHGLSSNLQFIRELDGLETMRKNWEVTEMAASHARLYAILTGVYAYYYKMKDKC